MAPPNYEPEPLSTLLANALAFLLPSPLLQEDFVIISATRRPVRANETPAIALGRRGESSVPLGPNSDPHETYEFRLFPANAGARALIPPEPNGREYASLVRPRSRPDSMRGHIRNLAAQRLPQRLVRTLSAPVRVVVPATSEPVAVIREIVDRARLGVFLGNRSNDRRPAIHVFSEDGALAAIVKWSTEEAQRVRQLREQQILTALKRVPSLGASTPTVLGHVRGHAGDALVTDAFFGKPAPRELSPSLLEWLRRCRIGGELRISRATAVTDLLQALEPARPMEAILVAAVERSLPHLTNHVVPVTVVHGDFVPWNIVFGNGSPKVFDWEYACIEGIPEWDRSFFPLQVGLVAKRWHAKTLIERVVAMERSGSPFYPVSKYKALLLLVMTQMALRQVDDPERRHVVRRSVEALLSGEWLPAVAPNAH